MIATTLLLLPLAPAASTDATDVREAVLAAVETQWAKLSQATLDAWAYRDKQTFCRDLDELFAREKATDADRAKVAAAIADTITDDSAPGYVWRVHELRARLLAPVDAKERRDALASALTAYPDEDYAQPNKHSLFHHVQNRHFAAVWDVDGPEAAEEHYRDALKGDRRFRAVYTETLVEVFVERGATERVAPFMKALAAAVEARDRRLATSLRAVTVPDVRRLDDDPRKRFVVLGAEREAAGERPIVVVLPGGNGQALDFLPWLTDLTAPLLDEYLFVVLSAPVWSEEQASRVVWVTERWKREFRAEFTVEAFARDVVASLKASDEKLTEAYLFAWSSGGPAAYRTICDRDETFAGAYVLASVFKPNDLKQQLKHAKGKRFFLEQGKADRVTAFHFAQDAKQTLAKRGAETKLVPFEGGHGFAMPDPKESLENALEWLTRR